MTEELIIDGQRVDLASDTDITLEYVNNIIGDIGSLKLSHSYTIKLPRTVKNSRIFDAPEAPSHESCMVRKFFTAEYYKNGFDLIGPAQAHLLRTTPNSYEVALVWNRAEELAAWIEAKAKLPSLTGLPTLTWVGAPLATTSTSDGVFYAKYDSGLWDSNIEKNFGRHPSITLLELIDSIFNNAGISYDIGNNFFQTLRNYALLVAPSHKPNFDMELESGSQAASLKWIKTTSGGSYWWFQDWRQGWDAPGDTTILTSHTIQRGPKSKLRFYLNLKITSTPDNKLPDLTIQLDARGLTYTLQPEPTQDGGFLLDEEVDLDDAVDASNDYDYFSINIKGLKSAGSYEFASYDTRYPMFALIRQHDTISATNQNLFPVAPNLPDIGQLDFLKAVLGLFGGVMRLAPDGTVLLEHYDDILYTDNAVDWTDKVDCSKGDPDISFTLSDYAQKNVLKYAEDIKFPVSPDITLTMEDQTATEQKDLLKLPFAASKGGQARHYRRVGGSSVDATWEDIDIKPRIFGITHDDEGTRCLYFGEDLSGSGAVSAHLAKYQELIRKPVKLTLNVRLTEMDLVNLDLWRPVYLAQYGRYYAILKVQTSKSDLCKVELLQLP